MIALLSLDVAPLLTPKINTMTLGSIGSKEELAQIKKDLTHVKLLKHLIPFYKHRSIIIACVALKAVLHL